MRKPKGSITVFAALSFMVIASVLFTFIEAARVEEVKRVAQWNTQSALESVFSQYDTAFWKKYHLLAINANGQEDDIDVEQYMNGFVQISEKSLIPDTNAGTKKMNLLAVRPTRANATGYTLITDQNGEIFEALVASYMKQALPGEIGKDIYNDFFAIDSIKNSYEGVEQATSEAKDALEEQRKEEKKAEKIEDNFQKSKTKNPMDLVSDSKRTGILELVLDETSSLSCSEISLSDTLWKRNRMTGRNSISVKTNWYDDVLMDYYITTYFSNYLTDIEEEKTDNLQYEMEYILAGKKSDEENLKAVVYQILAIREAANMMYLYSNSAKNAEALSMAMLIAGASANPIVIEAVKCGLIAAWAYVESILDVRALLKGDKIAIIKTPATWTTDLMNLDKALDSNWKAVSSDAGLTYTQYLSILLLEKISSKTSYRTMDIQEQQLREIKKNSAFRMDEMMVGLEVDAAYQWNTVFLSFVSLGNVHNQLLEIENTDTFSYLSAGV